MAMRTTETRRRRREASSSSSSMDAAPLAGEAHYRDVVLQLQSEFTRVVTALESRTATLEQLHDELRSENTALRSALSDATQRELAHDAALREAQEQVAMAHEESASQQRDWQTQYEQLTTEWMTQQEEWETEKAAHTSEYKRVVAQLHIATAQLAQEQQRNAHMSQEIQLLQCRVDAAVKTSRSFEARLQQLKQLKKDEKHDFETQVNHLKKRLEDKKEQNRHLADALMDKEQRRTSRKERQESSDASLSSNGANDAARKATSIPKMPRYQLPQELDDKKIQRHRYDLYSGGGSPLSGFLEDLQSHAPTSPTSSTSPTRSPRSLASSSFRTTAAPTKSHRPTTTTTTTTSARPQETRTSGKIHSTTSTTTTTRTPTTTATRSERMAREMERLRRKLDACSPLATSSESVTSPRWR